MKFQKITSSVITSICNAQLFNFSWSLKIFLTQFRYILIGSNATMVSVFAISVKLSVYDDW